MANFNIPAARYPLKKLIMFNQPGMEKAYIGYTMDVSEDGLTIKANDVGLCEGDIIQLLFRIIKNGKYIINDPAKENHKPEYRITEILDKYTMILPDEEYVNGAVNLIFKKVYRLNSEYDKTDMIKHRIHTSLLDSARRISRLREELG